MEKNTDYFDGRSDAEKMQNVANMIHDIVSKKPEKNLKVQTMIDSDCPYTDL